jgi:hypothetical protein
VVVKELVEVVLVAREPVEEVLVAGEPVEEVQPHLFETV